MIGFVSGSEAGQIRDAFAQLLLAIEAQPRQRLIGAELIGERRARCFEMLEVRRSPPVTQLAAGVEICAGIVEAVADLVADRGADRAIVDGGIGLGIVERRLEDRRREVERVLERQVDRVDRLRGHPPFAAIDRLGDLGQLVAIFGELGRAEIAHRIIGADGDSRIAAPALGIADPDAHRLDLVARLGLGSGRHPIERGHAPVERGEDTLHHHLDVRLGRGRKVTLGVDAADRVAEIDIDGSDRTLLARALLGRSVQRLAVEIEMGIVDRLGQHERHLVDPVEGQPVLPGLQRLAGDEPGETGDRAGLPREEVLLLAKTGRREIGVPVDARRLGAEVGAGPGIVRLVDVLAGNDVGVRGGDLGLQRDNPVGARRRVGDARERQQARDIGLIGGADLGHLGGGREIIIAIR